MGRKSHWAQPEWELQWKTFVFQQTHRMGFETVKTYVFYHIQQPCGDTTEKKEKPTYPNEC